MPELPSLFSVKGASKQRPRGSESPVTAQTPTDTAVSGVGITKLLLRKCNLTTMACGRWRLVTNSGEAARGIC